jgi:hypothetical protein
MARIAFSRLEASDFVIFEATGSTGASIDFEFSRPMARSELAAFNVFVEGTASVEKISGVGGITTTQRNAGDSTFDELGYAELQPGVVRMTVTSDFMRYYCIKNDQNYKITGETLRLSVAQVVSVPTGKWLFVACGSAVIDGEVYLAPRMITAKTKNVDVTLTEGTIAVVITKE